MGEFWHYAKLLISFSMSGIYSFLKYLFYRQTQTSSNNVKNIQRSFGSPRRDSFVTFRDPCLGRDPFFENH